MNRAPTADALGLHERASATPVRADTKPEARFGQAPDWSSGKLDLRRQQEWLAAIVSTPEAEPAPVDAASAVRLIKPSKTLSALARIDIYRQGYHARLVECLIDDYPVLQHSLGVEGFEALCRRYIAAHPSRAASLNYFGRHMSEFCRGEPLAEAGFAADLAALEWAIVLGIHAATAPTFGFDDLGRVPPESWPGARLSVNPSLSVLRLAYPVNAYLQSYRDGNAPTPPSPKANAVAVYRTFRNVWRLELEPELLTLIECLAAGATLEAALGQVQALLVDRPEAEAARLVSRCFQHGVASGLFSGITL